MRSLPFIGLIFLSTALSAQPSASAGQLEGTIYDKASGERLIGATVLVEGTALGASSDVDGQYLVRNIPAGTYSVRVSLIGHVARTFSRVVITAGETERLDVVLEEVAVQADEVVVTARAITSAEASVLNRRRQAATIGDGISAEMIKRAPDATSADALKRVVGVSLIENKYVLVRGVSDRYNQATLNGATMNGTDTESDKRSFSFDMIPSNLLDNTVVVKSATPDKPGDFTGGLVEMKTMDFPEERLLKISVGSSAHTLTTGRSVASSTGGQTDWLGIDDGSRKAASTSDGSMGAWTGLPNAWSDRTMRAPLNQNLSLAYGDQVSFDGLDLGVVAALSYRNGYERSETIQDFVIGSGPLRMHGTNDEYSVLWGGLADLHARFSGGRHVLSWNNAYNRSADQKNLRRSGVDFQDREVRSYQSQWIERSLQSSQVRGEHEFGSAAGLRLNWRMMYGASRAQEPDRRKLKYQRQNGDTGPFAITGTENNERAWTDLSEFTRGGGLDVSLPIRTLTLKVGGLVESSNRSYHVLFTSAEYLGSDFDQTFLPPDSIFLPQHFGPGQWTVRTLSSRSDEYDADRRVMAAYGMLDAPFTLLGERLRFVGGMRWEKARLRAFTYQPSFADGRSGFIQDTAQIENDDLLPSMNLTYVMNDRLNLRLAFSRSVNRPELREMANVSYYDFVNYEEVRGNPALRRARVDNYDARIEFYPGIGEVAAMSFFYKKIHDAIEQQVVWSSNPGKQYINTPLAENVGMEIELRKSFSFVHPWLERLSFAGNYSRIISRVRFEEVRIVGLTPDFVPIKEAFTDIRTMQGQASYTMNGGLHFSDPDIGTSASITLNRFGLRMDAVADIREEDVFERPRTTVDLSLTQRLTSSIEVKLSARDVGASARRYEFRTGQVFKNVVVGSTYGIQISYTF